MVKLFLVRHGETDWNKTGRYQGHTDIDLNATGIWQAERLRDRLAEQKIDAVYSSDLRRALHTAEIVTSRHNSLSLISLEELRELNFGKLEGLNFEQVQLNCPEANWWSGRDSGELNVPGGETLSQLADRTKLFISKLGKHSSKETVLIVAHGGFLRMLLCLLLDIDTKHWWQIQFNGASLTRVEIHSEVVVLSLLNDTCHLRNSSSG